MEQEEAKMWARIVGGEVLGSLRTQITMPKYSVRVLTDKGWHYLRTSQDAFRFAVRDAIQSILATPEKD